jgi:hypothetical protein
MAWVSPKLDWDTNPINPTEVDLNRIEGNIDFLKTDIETKKGAIVDALNTVGITASLSDTHAELASAITGAEQTAVVITPSTVDQAIPNGIYDTGGGVVSGDADLVASNIKSGVNIFGVNGTVKDLNSIYLYKSGMNNYSDWVNSGYYNNSIYRTITLTNVDLYIRTTQNLSGAYVTIVKNAPIDLTSVSRIRAIGYNSSSTVGWGIAVSTTKYPDSAIDSNLSTALPINNSTSTATLTGQKTALELDVSALSGNYYVYIVGHVRTGTDDTTTRIYEVTIE